MNDPFAWFLAGMFTGGFVAFIVFVFYMNEHMRDE